jgi:hypothetical protein
MRVITFLGGALILFSALGFIFQMSFATAVWPWPDGRLSYLFVGSILAAASVAALWIGWAGVWGALPAGALNILVIGLFSAVHFIRLYVAGGSSKLLLYAFISGLMAFVSMAAFFWSQKFHLTDSRPTPRLVSCEFHTGFLLHHSYSLVEP